MLRNFLREFAYATPLHRWLGLGQQQHYDQVFWDRMLAAEWKTFLGETVGIEVRNSTTLALIRMFAPGGSTILDVGCGSGSLFRTPGCEKYHYTGIDISAFAIGEARKKSPTAQFHVSRLEDFTTEESYDVITFGEVLYYSSPVNAVHQVVRYADWLKEAGVLVVTMKKDPQSQAIFRLLKQKLIWVNGVLCQEKNLGPAYSLRRSHTRPPYLLGTFKRS